LKVKQAREALSHQLSATPTVAAIAAHLGVTEDDVLDAMEAGSSYWPSPLDALVNDEDRATEIPVIDESFEGVLNREMLKDLLPQLDRREQVILKLHFFDGWTQQRIAEEVGVSQMQVSRLLAKTLAKLRNWFEAD
jgi:RNA polymerase sigma-B factor